MASIEPTKIDPKTGRPARDARWRARYRDPAGRSRSQTFNRKLDAERFLNSTGVDIDRGDFIDPRTQRSTFGERAELWWDSAVHLKPSTVRGYRPARDRLVAEFGDWPVAKIDRAEVKGFVARLSREGLSGKTIRNNVLVLALILTEAVEGRVLRENPARGVKIPKAPAPDPRFLTAEQVAALVNATRPDYRFLVLFLAYTGLRSSEACGLRIRNLDVIRGRVRVVETLMQIEGKIIVGTPKNYKGRTVPLPEFLRDEAARYLAARSAKLGCVLDPDELVFPPIRNARQSGRKAEFLVSQSVRQAILKPALAHAGLPGDVRVHDLRHTAASLLIQLGAHPRAIMDWLGHTDIKMTLNVYGHLFPSVEEDLTERLDALYRSSASNPWKPPTGDVVSIAS